MIRNLTLALSALCIAAPLSAMAFDGPELYSGEKALYEKAKEE